MWAPSSSSATTRGSPLLGWTVALLIARLALVKAELGLGLCDRALRTTRDVIKGHPNISEAYMLRGMALLFSADIDQVRHAQVHVHVCAYTSVSRLSAPQSRRCRERSPYRAGVA